MKIKDLKLTHFRNYSQQTVAFDEGINILLGENAQGKTNLIEALHVLALTKSHRSQNDKDLIQWDQEFCRLEGRVSKKQKDQDLKIILHSKGKRALVGNLEQKKLSDYIGHLLVVIFAPEDLEIIKGAPAIRRRFLDMQIGQVDQRYLKQLSQYQRLLKQRNKYLKGMSLDMAYLDVLTEQLAQQAAILLKERLTYVQALNRYAQGINLAISQQRDRLEITYMSQISGKAEDPIDKLYQDYLALFRANRQKEVDKRTSLFGIHRDDLLFTVNGHNVQDFGSQGQQRTVALSVKLAEIDLIQAKTGEYPILLLDDVLSELDDLRQTYLLKTVENKVQTFITTTNVEGIQKNLIQAPTLFYVREGSVVKDD